jgi:hypothetical protein
MVVGLGQQIVFGERIAKDDRITSHHPNRAEHFAPVPASIPEGNEEEEEKNEELVVVDKPAPHANASIIEHDDIEFDEEAEVALEVDADYQADGLLENGFISHSYCQGLPPYQFYSHSMGGREGLLQTSEKTKETGTLHKQMIEGGRTGHRC